MSEALQFHTLAEAFPLCSESRLQELADDIETNGLLEPIVLYEGKILDGRNRYLACAQCGVEPRFEQYRGDAPVSHVASMNLKRRDLTDGQRACVAVALLPALEAEAKKRQGHRSDIKEKIPGSGKASERAGSLLAVNPHYVSDAKRLKIEAPAIFEKVKSGEMKMPEARRKVKRTERLAAIAKAQKNPKSVVPTEPADVILADPPWRYDFSVTVAREVENQYPTLDLATIMSHIPRTKDNAVLFLWATVPKLFEAGHVLAAWGFEYRTAAVWDKVKMGMGYWFRSRCELLLVGTKGRFAPPMEDLRVDNIFSEKRQAHSRKPECVYRWIESVWPDKVKLELYARKQRQGWICEGNEV